MSKDERLPGVGTSADDVLYSIDRIDDTSEGFTVTFTADGRTAAITLAARPPGREQMEYAHAGAQGYLDGVVAAQEVPPEAIL